MGLALGEAAMQWLEDKGCSIEEAARRGLYTATMDHDDKLQPDEAGEILAIPFNVDDKPVGFQFRMSDDKGRTQFKHTGSRTFWNADAIDAAVAGNRGLLIVGGPIDALACLSRGVESVVGLPDGPVPDNHVPKPDKDIDTDPLFSWLVPLLPKLRKIRRIVLCLGESGASQRMRNELARRLGRARCSVAVVPNDLKDIGDYIAKGASTEELMALIKSASPIPVSGLYRMSAYLPGERVFLDSGFRALEPIMAMYRGAYIIISGLPMSGKSVFADQLAFHMNIFHGWKVGFATFEEEPNPDLQRKLRHFYMECDRREWTDEMIADADRYIEQNFCFITRDPTGNDDDDITVDWLCSRIEDAVTRYGVDMVVVDPWNEIDHRKLPGEQRDEYINRALRKLKDTAKKLDVCLVIVAHPTKEAFKEKEGKAMSLYDISDGAAWANKAEIGLIVFRLTHNDLVTEIHCRKAKFRGSGKLGKATLYFDESKEMFGS